MLEYVPNQAVQSILDDQKSYYRPGPGARMKWECAKRILEISGVPYDALLVSYLDKLKGFRFRSEQPVQQVPLESYTLPVSMFEAREPIQYDNTLLLPDE